MSEESDIDEIVEDDFEEDLMKIYLMTKSK